MGQRIVPRRQHPPRYYFKRTEHGLERRLLVADENGRYVPAPENPSPTTSSKLSDAERTRLKAVLKNALANVNYAQAPIAEAEGSIAHTMVLNVDAAEAEFRGELFDLSEEVLLEDPFVFHAFHMRLRSQVLQKQMPSTISPMMPSPPRPSPPRPIVKTPTAHPGWYLGFWNDSCLHLEVDPPSGPPDIIISPFADIVVTVGSPNAPYPRSVLTYQLYQLDLVKGVAGFYAEFYFSRWNPAPPVPEEKPALKRRQLQPTVMDTLEQLIYDPNTSKYVGTLIVYHASQWQGRCVGYKIPVGGGNEETGTYFDPDLFDCVTVKISARKTFTLKKVSIKLNRHWLVEDKENPPVTIKAGCSGFVELSGAISLYRKYSVLYKNDPNALKRPQPLFPQGQIGRKWYDPELILQNKIIMAAARYVGVGWCRKFGSMWGKKPDGSWFDMPGDWCGRFAVWAIGKGKSPVQLPTPTECHASKITDTFISQNRYLYPNQGYKTEPNKGRLLCTGDGPKYIHYPVAKPTSYSRLGDLVHPGYHVYLRGHTGLFLYWIQTDNEDRYYQNLNDNVYDNFSRVLNSPYVPKNDWLPGNFRPELDINYFCIISGNYGSSVVAKCMCAVIRLEHWNARNVKNLINNSSITFIPWFDEGDGVTLNEIDSYWNIPTIIITGFGKTD